MSALALCALIASQVAGECGHSPSAYTAPPAPLATLHPPLPAALTATAARNMGWSKSASVIALPSSSTATSPPSLVSNAESMSFKTPSTGPSSDIALLRKYVNPMLSCVLISSPFGSSRFSPHRATPGWFVSGARSASASHFGRVPRLKTSVCDTIAYGDSSGP